MSHNIFRIAAGTLTAAVAIVGLSACTQAGPAAAPQAPAPTTTSAPAGPTMVQLPADQATPGAARPATAGAAAGAAAAAKPELKFPGTTDDVVFTGYDSKTGMFEFTKMVLKPAPYPDYVPDPSDPGTHRLPMAPNATVRPFAGDTFETCPPVNCTPDNVMQSVIGHEAGSFWAHIHVNNADQIDSVIQSDY